MLITPAYAQGFDLGSLFNTQNSFIVPMGLFFVVFYFLMLRPQQQKQKELRRALAALKRGDKVVTGGGILGVVQKVSTALDRKGNPVAGPEVEVEIAPNIRVTVLRETITTVVKPAAANDAKPPATAKKAG